MVRFTSNIVIIFLPNPIISAKIEVKGADSLIKRPLYFEFKPILHISEAVHIAANNVNGSVG